MNPGTQTFVVAITGGVLAQAISRVMRLPAIIPLLVLGILLGPQGLSVMPKPETALGQSLNAIVALGVALILFEGGMSLNRNDFRLAPVAVRNLITIGAAISLVGGMLCAHFIAGMDWTVSVLYGALMIVTGPTVISPLLKNVRVVPRVHTVLLWEGILIDAVGAITAVVILELVLEEIGVFAAGFGFIGSLVVGPIVGVAGGWALATLLAYRKRKGWYDEEFDRLLALAGAVGIYGLSERLFSESGLGAVTCAGLVMANMLRHDIEELRRFKGVITTLLISVLFVMLAANFNLADLFKLWPTGFLSILALMLIVRPISVFVCTYNSKLLLREKIFISWIGPRGIVAASISSLFALMLKENGKAEVGDALAALTFATIVVTVLLNGFTAYPLAWVLGILVKKSEGILIIGANELALCVARIYEQRGFHVLLVDTNPGHCKRAQDEGFRVMQGDALNADTVFQQDLSGVGCLLALTTSSKVNAAACAGTAQSLKVNTTFSVISPTTVADDLDLLKATKTGVAFAANLDTAAVNNLIQHKKSTPHVLTLPLKTTAADAKPFLPLVIENQNGIQIYTAGTPLTMGTKLIGLQFEVEDDAVPFSPACPHCEIPEGKK